MSLELLGLQILHQMAANKSILVRYFFGFVILTGMIFAATYGAGDLFVLIMGGVFIVLGIINIVQYVKAAEMIGSLGNHPEK